MINPSVSNADKSSHYVAFILEDLKKKLGVPFSRGVVERAIRDGKFGSTCDSRYFLKEGVTTKGSKRDLRKARCCTIKIYYAVKTCRGCIKVKLICSENV